MKQIRKSRILSSKSQTIQPHNSHSRRLIFFNTTSDSEIHISTFHKHALCTHLSRKPPFQSGSLSRLACIYIVSALARAAFPQLLRYVARRAKRFDCIRQRGRRAHVFPRFSLGSLCISGSSAVAAA